MPKDAPDEDYEAFHASLDNVASSQTCGDSVQRSNELVALRLVFADWLEERGYLVEARVQRWLAERRLCPERFDFMTSPPPSAVWIWRFRVGELNAWLANSKAAKGWSSPYLPVGLLAAAKQEAYASGLATCGQVMTGSEAICHTITLPSRRQAEDLLLGIELPGGPTDGLG